jgi:hypothetical protein
MDHFRAEHRDPAVTVLAVVPEEEFSEDRARLLRAAETIGDLGTKLHRFEVAFRERIVIACVRTRVALGHAQLHQERRHRLAGHRRAPVGMQRELTGWDLLALKRFRNQGFGELSILLFRDAPADHVAAINIKKDVEIVITPLDGSFELGNVPTPDLPGSRCQQFRTSRPGRRSLASPLVDFVVLAQKPVHRRYRAEVNAVVEQQGIDLRRRFVAEALRMQMVEHFLLLLFGERSAGDGTGARLGLCFLGNDDLSSVVGRPGYREHFTGCGHRNSGRRLADRLQERVLDYSRGSRERPMSSETFFWRSSKARARSSSLLRRRTSRSEARSSCRTLGSVFSLGEVGTCLPSRSPRAFCFRKSESVEK